MATIIPCELDVGWNVVLGDEKGAARQDALRHVELGPVHELQVGRLVAVVDQAHHVAVHLQVDVAHIVLGSSLELKQLIVKGDDVRRVVELFILRLGEAAAAHLDDDLPLRDGHAAAHAPSMRT